MSELYDRAVEEQAAEQQGVGIGLDAELRQRLERVDGRLGQLETSMVAVPAGLEALHAELAGQRAALAPLDELARHAGDLLELRDGLAGVRTDLRQLPGLLAGAVAARLAEPLEVLREAQQRLAGQLSTDAETVSGQIAGLRNDLDAVRRLVLEDLPEPPDPGATAALFAGGVAEAVRLAVADALAAQLGQAAASEDRIRRYVDDAVLALAELMLRRSGDA